MSLVVPAPRSSAARRASWTDVRESSFPSPVSFGSVGGGTSGWALAPAHHLLGVTGRQKIPVAGPSPDPEAPLSPQQPRAVNNPATVRGCQGPKHVGPRAADQADTPMRSRPKDAAACRSRCAPARQHGSVRVFSRRGTSPVTIQGNGAARGEHHGLRWWRASDVDVAFHIDLSSVWGSAPRSESKPMPATPSLKRSREFRVNGMRTLTDERRVPKLTLAKAGARAPATHATRGQRWNRLSLCGRLIPLGDARSASCHAGHLPRTDGMTISRSDARAHQARGSPLPPSAETTKNQHIINLWIAAACCWAYGVVANNGACRRKGI